MKKMSARVLAFLLIIGLFCTGLTGCGKKQDAPQEPETSAPETTPEESGEETDPAPVCTLEAASSYDEAYTVLEQAAQAAGYVNSANLGVVEEFFSREDIPSYSSGFGERKTGAVQCPEGVQAADVTVLSGDKLYSVAGGQLRIFTAQGAQTRELSATQVCEVEAGYDNYEETAQAVAVSGTKAAVITYVYAWMTQEQPDGSWSDQTINETRVKLYDLSDPAAPKLTATFAQDGGYHQAVLTENTLYLLTDYYVYDFNQDDPETFVPHAGGAMVPAEQLLLNRQCQTAEYTVVSAISMDSGSALSSSAVTGAYHAVFASATEMDLLGWCYAAEVSEPYAQEQYQVEDYDYTAVTVIGQFDLSGGLAFRSSACVTGRITDFGAVDIASGTLRLATLAETFTNRRFTDDEFGWENIEQGNHTFSNEIHVLDGQLQETGSLTGLSEDTLLYYVRFHGDAAYVVAYDQKTPMYTIDLSDPAEPKQVPASWAALPELLLPYETGTAVGVIPDGTGTVSLAFADLTDPQNPSLGAAVQTEGSASCIQNQAGTFVSSAHSFVALPTASGVVLYRFANGSFEKAAEVPLEISEDTRLFEAEGILYLCSSAQTVAVELTGFTVVGQSASAAG